MAEEDKDPFAEFGGVAVEKAKESDPFSEFGGTSIEVQEKKNSLPESTAPSQQPTTPSATSTSESKKVTTEFDEPAVMLEEVEIKPKPEIGYLQSFMEGIESYDDLQVGYDVLRRGDKAKIIDYYNTRYNNSLSQTPNDNFIKNALRTIGGTVPMMGKVATGGAVGGAIGSTIPVVGTAVGAASGTIAEGIYEGQKLSKSSAFEEAYFEAKSQNKTDDEAFEIANNVSKVAQIAGGVEGGISGLAGGTATKSGTSVLKNLAKEIIADATVGATAAGARRGTENIAAQQQGLERKTTSGIGEEMTGEAAFSFGLGLLLSPITQGKNLIGNRRKKIITAVAATDAPKAITTIDKAVEKGEVSQEDADALKVEIVQTAKAFEATPESMPYEEREALTPVIAERQKLQKEFEKVSPATQPIVQAKIELIDKSIPIPLPPKYMNTAGQNTSELKDGQLYITRKGDVRMWDAAQKQFLEPPKSFEVEAKKETEQVKPTEEAAPQPEVVTQQPAAKTVQAEAEVAPKSDALKDVESTAKALEEVGKKKKTAATETGTRVVGNEILEGAEVNSETLGISQKISEGFTKAGEQSKIDKSPKALGEWLINNAQTGDRIIVDEDTYWVVERKTDKKGNTEIELQQYFRNENDVFENNPSAVKLFNSKHIGTETAKLSTRDASDLFESSYRNSNGDVVVQQSKYIPASKNSKSISEAYHRAKADGSNSELVKAVEELLAPESQVKPLQTEAESQVVDELKIETEKYETIKNKLPKSEYTTENDFKNDFENGEWALLTAENPNNSSLSAEENAKRNKEAEQWLIKKGYKPQPIAGKYNRAENSFYVKGMTKADAIAFANIFGQENVATDNGLFYQDGSYQERVRGNEKYGSQNNYVSAINIGGKSFEFSADYSQDKIIPNKNEKQVSGNRLFSKPLEDAKIIADRFAQKFGFKRTEFEKITRANFDKERAKRIAKAFDEMQDNPNDPQVKAAYEAMAKETIEQYKEIIKNGYTIEVNNTEPYGSSEEMIEDLRNNKRMKIFSTESGFGDDAITPKQRAENPLLRDSGYKDVNGVPLLVNDVFRFVHDFFGHAELGNSFGEIGEENAWNVHARMYSPLARRAMTTETRGQNSWVNSSGVNKEAFKIRDKARKLREVGESEAADALVQDVYDKMKFAEQKVGLLPEEFSKTNEELKIEQEKPTIFDQYDNTKGASKKDKVIEQYAKESGKDKADRVRDIIDNFDAIKSRLQELISEGKIDNIEIRC